MFLFIVSFQQGPCIRSLRGPRAWLKGHLMLAPVAQLDRALPSEGRGQRFESSRVRHFCLRVAASQPNPHLRVGLFRRKSTAVRTSLIFVLTTMFPLNSSAAESPTIASTSLCGDSYLLALAPDHISALSWQSRSPLSRASEAQRALPQIWDDPEVLLSTDADIILFGAGEGKFSDKLGKKAVTLKWGEDFETLKLNADAIHDIIALPTDVRTDWADRVKTLKNRSNARNSKPKILYLSRSGGSAGTGTFVDSAIKAAGGENAALMSGWFTPDPEDIIAYEPDLIITSFFKNGYESVQSTAFRNKVVQRFIAKYPSVEIDGSLWPCAGPGLIEAAELISEAIDKLP